MWAVPKSLAQMERETVNAFNRTIATRPFYVRTKFEAIRMLLPDDVAVWYPMVGTPHKYGTKMYFKYSSGVACNVKNTKLVALIYRKIHRFGCYIYI